MSRKNCGLLALNVVTTPRRLDCAFAARTSSRVDLLQLGEPRGTPGPRSSSGSRPPDPAREWPAGPERRSAASGMSLSFRRRSATIVSWVTPLGRLSQSSYTGNMETAVDRLALSRIDRPPINAQPAIPGVSLRMALIFSVTRFARGCDAPGGKVDRDNAVALVLRRQEAGRQPGEHEAGDTDDDEIDQDHQPRVIGHEADDIDVARLRRPRRRR